MHSVRSKLQIAKCTWYGPVVDFKVPRPKVAVTPQWVHMVHIDRTGNFTRQSALTIRSRHKIQPLSITAAKPAYFKNIHIYASKRAK